MKTVFDELEDAGMVEHYESGGTLNMWNRLSQLTPTTQVPARTVSDSAPSWYTNPYQQYISVPGETIYARNEQIINPEWQEYENAVTAAKAAQAPTGLENSPWAIDAAKFHELVDPLLAGGSYWAGPQTADAQHLYLPLAGGKEWIPSGASSGITYRRAGEEIRTPVVRGWGDQEDTGGELIGINPYDYYEISGDLSRLLGQEGSDVHANVKYIEKDGKLVPVSEPAIWNWTNQNSLAAIMQDLGPIPNIALAAASGGMTLPQQIAASAALGIAQGGNLNDIAKAAASAYIGSKVSGLESVADTAAKLNEVNPALGSAFKSAVSGGTGAALTGGDIGQAALSGAASGATASGVHQLAVDNIPEFKDWTPSQQRIAENAMLSALSGKPMDQVALNAAIALGKSEVQRAIKEGPTTTPTGTYESSIKPDYSLSALNTGEGLKAPLFTDTSGSMSDVDYGISQGGFDLDDLGYGLQMPNYGSLPDMGGGLGLHADTGTAYVNEAGITPYGQLPALGDPSSFINQPQKTGSLLPESVTKPVAGGSTGGGGGATPKPSTPTQPTAPQSGPDWTSLMSLLGLLGQQQTPQAPVQAPVADIKFMKDLWSAGIDPNFLTSNLSGEDSNDDLLRTIRG